MQRQLQDHLPGGKFHEPSPKLVNQAKSCTSNNISGERIFAIWDSKHAKARSASVRKISSKTLFSANHVKQNYLRVGGKTKQEKVSIIRNATTQARVERSEDLKKRQILLSALNEKLESSRKLIEKKEANRRNEKGKYC